MPAPVTAINYGRLLLLGVAMPAGLALVNRLVLNSGTIRYFDGPAAIALFGFYVLQVAGVSWAMATDIRPWPLRWIIYGWTMLLVDLQLAFLIESVYSDAVRCLSSGIFAGQFGLFVVWGVMSRDSIFWRIPALLVLLAVYWNCYWILVLLGQPSGGFLNWSDLVVMQTVLLSILCGCLRLAGFSLAIVSNDSEAAPAGSGRKLLQFGIRDVLIGTTALALLLALAKAGDLLTLRYVRHIYERGFLFIFATAICTAIVLIIALWAALGRGEVLARITTLVTVSFTVGCCIAWYCLYIGRPQAMVPMRPTRPIYWLLHFYLAGYWWIGWMFLAGALLAAFLLIYRRLGYRLGRHVPCARPESLTGPSSGLPATKPRRCSSTTRFMSAVRSPIDAPLLSVKQMTKDK
ncbi:MAG: hypothetical protein L0211_12010 [Planctomycetaceae bacterium]|nr:hypothetical protein [Planctomycetaceae bacterium]